MRRELTNAGILATSVLISFLAVEAAIHLVEARRGPIFPGGMRSLSFTRPDPELGWKHAVDFSQRFGWPEHPDGYVTITTNNLGLREDQDTSPKPRPDEVRVLVLGDSHTDGLVDNDESWPNVWERSAAASGQRWEVLNAGVTGYQPSQYLGWWRRFGRKLEPDLVVVGYYLGNDLFVGDVTAEAEGGAIPSQETGTDRGFVSRAVRAVRHRCRLCALTSMLAHRWFLEGPTYEESMFVHGESEDIRARYLAAIRECVGCLWQSVEQHWRVDRDPGAYGDQLAATHRLLGVFRDEVEGAGSRLAVVLIPSKLQIEGEAARASALRTAALLGVEAPDDPVEDRLANDVRALLNRLGIPTIGVHHELTEAYERTGETLYYDADWHLNVIGSRIVGEAVGAALPIPADVGSPEGT